MFRKLKVVFSLLQRKLTNERERMRIQFYCIYLVFAGISLGMSIVNLSTGHGILSFLTLLFFLLNCLDVYLLQKGPVAELISKFLFCLGAFALFFLFLITGEPEGFSLIWTALFPIVCMLLFKRKIGSILSLVWFFCLAFFCWTEAGKALLEYPYSQTFLTRFPLYYAVSFLVGFFFEWVRALTLGELLRARDTYRRLSFTDQLTGLGNETAYFEFLRGLEKRLEERQSKFAIVVMDVNGLKITNDTHGHRFGCHLVVTAGKTLPSVFPGCRLFHVGGDEFVAILEGENCRRLGIYFDDFKAKLSYSKILFEGVELTLSVSGGYAYSDFGEGYSEVFQRADGQMYENKKNLKAKYHIGGR